ncbi:hypothetical protein CLOSTMETH_00564 [[Clostridium] methylpentosum DSM 5476]|uniref:Uncharacterized protein n=1 Tax=[Clostridium] methylpentosum DSM 5476 TaxID=537013 RepID=C0E9R3_9FIRM|nr:hypothetical protein CLOSTMETH_00564 [[Clostridium] methylpentosum DSM 5476]
MLSDQGGWPLDSASPFWLDLTVDSRSTRWVGVQSGMACLLLQRSVYE